jgi:hypothetical protein
MVPERPAIRLLREPLDAAGNRSSGRWVQQAQVCNAAPDSTLRWRFPVCRARLGARNVRFPACG